MKFIFTVLVLAAVVCHAEHPFQAFTAEDVNMIEFGDLEGFNDDYQWETYFSVTNRLAISNLYAQAKATDLGEGFITMIGVLSYQHFKDADGNLLASVHVINYKSEIVFETNTDLGFMTGYNRKYCRLVYELMRDRCPEVIREMDHSYRTSGPKTPLETLLFEGLKKDKKTEQKPEEVREQAHAPQTDHSEHREMEPVATANAMESLMAWLSPIIWAAVLTILVVGFQFVRNRESLLLFVILAVFFGVTRLLIGYHIMVVDLPWSPSAGTYALLAGYCGGLLVLLALCGRRVALLWQKNGWGNRCLQVFTLTFFACNGVLNIVKPYGALLLC